MVLSEDYDQWLGPTIESDELRALLRPALMEAYAVSRAVNSVKNDNEECIKPFWGAKTRFDFLTARRRQTWLASARDPRPRLTLYRSCAWPTDLGRAGVWGL
jgi:hypothetical protein